MKSRILALLLAAVLIFSFAACGSQTVSESSTSAESAADAEVSTQEATEEAPAVEEPAVEAPAEESSAEETPAEETPVEEIPALFDYELPIITDSPTYTFLVGLNPGVSSFIDGYEDNQVIQEWTSRTGIQVEFNNSHPSAAAENFNLLLAAGDIPDITDNGLSYYNGSVTSAIEDEIFVNFMDYMDSCQNYMTAINTNEMIKKALTTDEGYVAALYMIRTNNSAGEGMMIRQDWLDELNLEIPSTYEEVHDVLAAFKSEKGAVSPMLLNNSGTWSMGSFGWGYGINGYMTTDPKVSLPLYVVDGEVRFAMLEDEYVDYLTMLSQWYSEGLIVQDIESISMFQMCTQSIINGETGYFYSASSMLSTYNEQSATEGFQLSPAPQPVINEGDALHFGQAYDFDYEGGQALAAVNHWTVSATAEELESLLTCLDYFFSPAGSLLANYGVEDVSFTYDADGVPHFTDVITNNAEGMTMDNAVYIYTLQYGAFMEDYTRYVDTFTEQEQAFADAWNVAIEENYSYPVDFVSLTSEESDTYAAVFSDISTMLTENILKFITGANSMDEYDAFRQQLVEMGLEDIVQIYQDAYDRFLAR